MDCREGLKLLDDNSIASTITDPPYELGFMDKKWDKSGITYDVNLWKEVLRVSKPGATLMCFGGTRTFHRIAVAIEDAGWDFWDTMMWVYGSGFPKTQDLSKMFDKKNGKEEEHGYVTPTSGLHNGSGDNMKFIGRQLSDTPVSDEAKTWKGYHTHGFKPAWEPILCFRKENDGSYTDNARKHGVGGLNVDPCRIPIPEGDDIDESGFNRLRDSHPPNCSLLGIGELPASYKVNEGGRFPANIIHDGEEETIKLFPKDGFGSAARFFYCGKPTPEERHYGFPNDVDRKKLSLTGRINRDIAPTVKYNYHPTVKPLELMKYLCQLTRQPDGGIVLDPFMGSGTTACAARLVNRPFIGFEMDPGYRAIAMVRFNQIPKRLEAFDK
jgi:site-specific DNA-methyltransferase (adenine-specific)